MSLLRSCVRHRLSPAAGTFSSFSLFFFNDPATTEIYTLSLHDALPISAPMPAIHRQPAGCFIWRTRRPSARSEEHTSELQSLTNLVCRLLLEKKKKQGRTTYDDCEETTAYNDNNRDSAEDVRAAPGADH